MVSFDSEKQELSAGKIFEGMYEGVMAVKIDSAHRRHTIVRTPRRICRSCPPFCFDPSLACSPWERMS